MMDLSIVPAIVFSLLGPGEPEKTTLLIKTDQGQINYVVEIADDPFEQIRGLMRRPLLPDKTGMLFLYDHDRQVQFWMKDVSFPLDMIFLDRCGSVIQIHENAQPGDERLIASNQPVRAVLEIPGGASKRDQIRKDHRITLPEQQSLPRLGHYSC